MMTLVETITVGSGGAASIEFTGIPGTGKDLMVLLSNKLVTSAGHRLQIRVNSVSADTLYLQGYGTGVQSGSYTVGDIGAADSDTPTANTFGSAEIYISNYATSVAHSFSANAVIEANSSAAFASFQQLTAGLTQNTDAVTSVGFLNSTGTFAEHTTASLYSIS